MDAEPHLVSVVRRAVSAWLAAMRWPEPQILDIVFAISEVVSNSVEHAYRDLRSGRVTVELVEERSADDRVIRVVVTDFGRWRPGRSDRDRGNGLALIHAIVDSLRVHTDDSGTRVAMCASALR